MLLADGAAHPAITLYTALLPLVVAGGSQHFIIWLYGSIKKRRRFGTLYQKNSIKGIVLALKKKKKSLQIKAHLHPYDPAAAVSTRSGSLLIFALDPDSVEAAAAG